MPHPRNRAACRSDVRNSNGLADGHRMLRQLNMADLPGCAQDAWREDKLGDGNAKHSR
jgi:hypothetical protein